MERRVDSAFKLCHDPHSCFMLADLDKGDML